MLVVEMSKQAKYSSNKSTMLLKASAKQLFETLMDQTADRIYIKDRDSRFIAVSQPLAEIYGYKDRHQLEGMTDFELFSSKHAQQAYDDEQEILRTGKPIVNKIEKEVWKDGSTTWISSSKAPLHLSSERCAGIIGISRDVTQEIIAQEQLATSERRLREQNEVMHSDYQSAKRVQTIMIPGRIPRIKHINLAYMWKPMASVGGDLISFPHNPHNCLLFFMGDVCGHGITAAFYTVLLKYLTAHAAEVYNDNPREYLMTVNEEVVGQIEGGFVTALAGHFGRRLKDGSRILHIAHAGHPFILHYQAATQTIEHLNLPSGMVMGIPGGMPSKNFDIRMKRGDRFYAFTDGIIEASNPEGDEFGMKQLAEQFRQNSQLPLQKTLETIYTEVLQFTQQANQQDDISFLAFELD